MNFSRETHVAGLIAWRFSPLLDVVQYRELLKEAGSPANLFNENKYLSYFPELAEKLKSGAFWKEAKATLESWREQGIGVIVLGDDDYPEELLNISDPPLLLTYRGDWYRERFSFPRVSIVGSRRADSDGIEIAHHFGAALSESGATVVSGLAIGIDGAAHRGAISVNNRQQNFLPTIAILGNGLSQIYPRSHTSLAKEILERGGLLLSQFEPNEPAYPMNFLNRNRLIAALSIGTLVIQASDKSGSLVTARHALEYGKELFIVPGSIKDPRYVGSNRLLQHGAHLVTTTDDLFDLMPRLHRSKKENAASPRQIAPECRWIVEQLSGESQLSVDSLFERSPNPDKFFEQILTLEMEGLISRLPGNMLELSTKNRLEIPNSPA